MPADPLYTKPSEFRGRACVYHRYSGAYVGTLHDWGNGYWQVVDVVRPGGTLEQPQNAIYPSQDAAIAALWDTYRQER